MQAGLGEYRLVLLVPSKVDFLQRRDRFKRTDSGLSIFRPKDLPSYASWIGKAWVFESIVSHRYQLKTRQFAFMHRLPARGLNA